MGEESDDRPIFDPGEIICSENGDFAFRIEDLVGEGRCCLVYSARSIRDNGKVALKFFKRGQTYEGALQRELYILNLLKDKQHKIVSCYGYFRTQSLHCQVMEFLEWNVRQLIFRNDRQGFCPWAVQKFAHDLLTSLQALHSRNFVHADLKPANVMWSSNEGCFKLLDFGLSFHTQECDLHQIQSKGYQAPESAIWNSYKDDKRNKRKRKLQAVQSTFCNLSNTDACFDKGALEKSACKDRWPSESSGIFTASEQSQCNSFTSQEFSSLDSSSVGFDPAATSPTTGITSETYRHPAALVPNDTADWRRGGRKQLRNVEPPMPGAASDLWAFGCLLFEVLTGFKLFRAGDLLASVLKPRQLLEMKIGESEVRYCDKGESELFSEVKDLISLCLADDPGERCSAIDALNHSFMQRRLLPSVLDMALLSTNVLLLMDILKAKATDEKNMQEIISDIRCEASKFGTLTEIKAHGDHVYVEFQEASDCQRACKGLSGRTFDTKLVLALFYPTKLWINQTFLSSKA